MTAKAITKFAGLVALSLTAIILALVVSRQVQKTAAYSPEPYAVPATNRRGRTAVWIDNTVHYDLRGSAADAEYLHLAPPISTEDSEAEFSSTAMIHQLQCLQIIRADYNSGRLSEITQHCMEYLRQSILCSADTRLESVRFFRPPHVVALPGEYECKDWIGVLKKTVGDGF